MKLYLVVASITDGWVKLYACESKDLASNTNPAGLTFEEMFGPHAIVCRIGSRKSKALKYIREDLIMSSLSFKDCSKTVIRLDTPRKQPTVPEYKAKQVDSLTALRNSLIRCNMLSVTGNRYMVIYEQFGQGEYILMKHTADDPLGHVEYSAESAEDILVYMLNKAHSNVDNAKDARQHKQAQEVLKQVLLVICEYERCHRLQ